MTHPLDAERGGQPLPETMQRADPLPVADAALAARQAELNRLDATIASRREDSQRLSGILSGLRQEQDHMEELLPSLRDRATMDIKRLGDETVVAIRDQAVMLRRELDLLLQQSLDVAKTAAAVDADIRTKEWLKRLLDLIEGGDDVRPQEVRSLAFTFLTAVGKWADRHPGAAPREMKEDLDRLVVRVREWRG